MAYLGPHAAASAYPAGRVHSALPTDESAQAAFGALWLHEIKHDGFRVIARKDGAQGWLPFKRGRRLADLVFGPGKQARNVGPMHDP